MKKERNDRRSADAFDVRIGQIAWIGLALVVATAVVYAEVRDHEFVSLDDRALLVDNENLGAGLGIEGLDWAFRATTDGNWIPLTWVSFLADQELHGLAPGTTQLTNVAIHALSTVLLFLALLRMTGALGPSAFAAAVFALHPIHVESVAWAMERKDVLSGLFFHATLLGWAGFATRPSVGRYALVLTLTTAGLLAKPMLVTLPFVLLLLDGWPLGRLGSAGQLRRAVVEKLPLLALSLVIAAVTLQTQEAMGAVARGPDFWLGDRLANALVSYASYPLMALWPLDLAVFYPHPRGSLPLLAVAASTLALVAWSALCVTQWRRRPFVLMGWLWYLGMLVPVIGIVQAGHQAMADRYTYLPLTGLVIALAWSGRELAARMPRGRPALATLALAALVAMAWQSTVQLRYWRDSVALFERALEVAPERNGVAHNALGFEWFEQGEMARAITAFRRALDGQPEFLDARAGLGSALLSSGRPDQAIRHLEAALGLVDQRRVIVLENLGIARHQTGSPELAVDHLREALRIGGPSDRRHTFLAMALVELERYSEAGHHIDQARALGLDLADVHGAWAQLEEARGRDAAAADRYRRALALRPDWTLALNNLAWLLATCSDPLVRDPEEAVRLAEEAARVTRRAEPNVLDTLSIAYAAAGRPEEADRVARQAARLARSRNDESLARDIEGRLRTPSGGSRAGP